MNKKALSFFRICHQWLGLIGGWFLFVLFVSGTVSIFDKEITQWMQPELGLYPTTTTTVSSKALNQAFDSWEQYEHIRKNLIALPTERDPYIRVLHFQDNILQGVVINPQQGNIIPVRATGGGYFIDSFHNNLFIGRYIGGAIVLIISIAFLLVLISGIIIYLPNLIKSAFFVYPKPNSLRFKSDIHTITGLFFLPFLFIISISGILFLAPRYLNAPPPPMSTPQKQNAFKQQRPDLLPLLKKAEIHFNAMPSSIVFTKKEIKFFESDQKNIAHLKNYVAFDKKTTQQSSSSTKPAPLTLLNKTLLGIHTVRAGDSLLRAIFALMGVFSSVLIAYGLLFYAHKKRNSSLSTRSITQSYFYKTIEGINIGVIMGTLIAMIALLWFNRLLPVSLSDRLACEIKGFFTTFFLILCCGIIASIWNKVKFIWISLMGILAGLCLFLPLLDYIQTGSYVMAAIRNHNYLYITTDVIVFLLGIVFLRLCFYIQNKGRI